MTQAWILDFLNRRAKVEQEMLDVAKAIEANSDTVVPLDPVRIANDLRDWALRLGVPEDAEPPASPWDARDAARLTDTRLRQMLEDYRDAWSPGARDELFAQYRAEIAAIERKGERD